jgi:ribosome biogenesis GTPase A
LSSWKKKIIEEKMKEYEDTVEIGETIEMKSVDTSYHEHVKFRDGILTIGCVGQPNAGKSSVINALMGKKVSSREDKRFRKPSSK